MINIYFLVFFYLINIRALKMIRREGGKSNWDIAIVWIYAIFFGGVPMLEQM